MKVLFCGTPEFAVPTLVAVHGAGHTVLAVVTQPDRPRGRGMKLAAP
ncbi:MAG: methionyl-tRNA formyltransferase, partial [Candidatus Acidiferrales bacterium]